MSGMPEPLRRTVAPCPVLRRAPGPGTGRKGTSVRVALLPTALVLVASTGAALAGPVALSEAQADRVTAGLFPGLVPALLLDASFPQPSPADGAGAASPGSDGGRRGGGGGGRRSRRAGGGRELGPGRRRAGLLASGGRHLPLKRRRRPAPSGLTPGPSAARPARSGPRRTRVAEGAGRASGPRPRDDMSFLP